MRRHCAALVGIVSALLMPLTVAANCVGSDLIPQLQAESPDAVAQMFLRAKQVPNGQGRFWKIERAGQTTSHLLGSFHAAEGTETLAPEMWAAFEAANMVVVEVDLQEQADMEVRMGMDAAFSFDLSGPGISARLTAEQRDHVANALAARGMRLEDVDKMRPWLLASLLSFPACHLQSMAAGEQPMDVTLAELALDKGQELRGLEGYEDAIAAFQRIDGKLLLDSIASTGELALQEEDLFRTNMNLYANGEVAAIPELGILLGEKVAPEMDHRAMSAKVLAEILDTRNLAWMDNLLEALKPGGTFVIVGALHLPGTNGLVELLRAEGYRVTRLDL
ncbi:MAG: TraB/GumN family protein [Paracoccaceae bacterium]